MERLPREYGAAGENDESGARAAVSEHFVEAALLVGPNVRGGREPNANGSVSLRVTLRRLAYEVVAKVVFLDHRVVVRAGNLLHLCRLRSKPASQSVPFRS